MDAYRKALGHGEKEYIVPPPWLMKFAEEVVFGCAMDEFHNQPTQYFTAPKPVNSAKQAALDAALAYIGRSTEITFNQSENKEAAGTRLVEMATTIYQWLTEPVTDKR